MKRSCVQVVVSVPKWSFAKRGDEGEIDFYSPFPAPFNYGFIVGTHAEDGDAYDAIVLGSRRDYGEEVTTEVLAKLRFIDHGVEDSKYICSSSSLTQRDRRRVVIFFYAYAFAKRLINWMRGKRGPTRFLGWSELDLESK